MTNEGNENYLVTNAVHKGILANNVNTERLQKDILLSMKKLFMKDNI